MNKLSRYRKLRYNQLFESENRELRLNEMGNPLEVLSQYVDFEIFRPTLESALFTGERKSNAGRPPIDCVLMFKVLFLQRYYGLSDHQIEYQIVDRTSFRKFLGIECVDDVPDEKTVWKYRELLTNTGVYDKLFSEFHSFMESKGLQFNEGRIIDASFVIAPRQRNTRDENEQIKQGAGNKLWNDNPHKKCHKDVDARWTKKRDETFYGYKQHTKVEKRNKIILSYDTTSAEVHDSKGFEGLLDEKDEGKDLYLDAGYVGQEEIVKQHKMNPIICEKGYRNRPLTKEQKSDNRKKSKTRCLVEHVFGFEEQTMRGLVVRTVGLIRAKANVALTSLVWIGSWNWSYAISYPVGINGSGSVVVTLKLTKYSVPGWAFRPFTGTVNSLEACGAISKDTFPPFIVFPLASTL